MNLFQKIAAKLFGWQYVVVTWCLDLDVHRVIKVGRHWALEGKRPIQPQGKVVGRTDVKWEPLTPGMAKFFSSNNNPAKSEEK